MAGPKLKTSEYLVIVMHNDSLIEAANTALNRLNLYPKTARDRKWVRTVEYWKDVRAALHWSTGIAKQRLGVRPNVAS